jgi:hypothetical protein
VPVDNGRPVAELDSAFCGRLDLDGPGVAAADAAPFGAGVHRECGAVVVVVFGRRESGHDGPPM